jgi:hypothetical protein
MPTIERTPKGLVLAVMLIVVLPTAVAAAVIIGIGPFTASP